MNPSKIAIRNPASVFILIAMIVTIGVMAYRDIPREAAPDIQVPLLIVTVPFPGASPEDVENLITHKVELELQNLDKLEEIRSTSAEGASAITLEFDLDFDVDDARVKVREALDKVRPELPADIEDPIITEINLSEQPLLLVNVSGGVGLVRLKDIADDLKDRVEAIPGILEVRRAGGLEREVQVYVDPEKLRYYDLDLNQVSSAIERENQNIPGGTLTVGPTKILIRTPGEFDPPQEIEDVVVAAPLPPFPPFPEPPPVQPATVASAADAPSVSATARNRRLVRCSEPSSRSPASSTWSVSAAGSSWGSLSNIRVRFRRVSLIPFGWLAAGSDGPPIPLGPSTSGGRATRTTPRQPARREPPAGARGRATVLSRGTATVPWTWMG